MDWAKKRKMMISWSILTAGIIALFWMVWYLCAGSVPVVHSLKMTSDWNIVLPFGLSRWWDILLGPIYSITLILLVTNKKILEDEYYKNYSSDWSPDWASDWASD